MEQNEALLKQLSRENQKAQNHVVNLMESFRAINSTLELDEVLKKIMQSALKIVETAEAGYIQMYDAISDKLIVKTYVGFNENIKFFKVNIGESITGKVFRDGDIRLIISTEEIYNSMANLSEENLEFITKAHQNSPTIKSILSVPVALGTKTMGVMTFHCFDVEDGLSETDLLLLQSFASQAATALYNAQLHTKVQNSLDEVTHLSKKLKETNAMLEKRTEIHTHLTKLSVQNKGLEAIILEMNKLMERKLVYADYLEGNYVPQHIQHIATILDDIFLLFANKTEASYVSTYDSVQIDCYIYPIRSGSVFLGCLIVEGNTPLSQPDQLIIEQGALTLSLEIMKLRSQTEIMYKKTYETYHRFLEIRNLQQAELVAQELGIHHDHFLQIALIELDGNADLLSLENDALLLLAHLKEKLRLENSLLFSYNNKITVLSFTRDSAGEGMITNILKNGMNWWNERFTVVARGGLSTGQYSPGQAKDYHMKAEKALLHLKKQKEKGLLHYRDIGISTLFLHHPAEEINSFLSETFSVLWNNNETNDELLHTLFTYIQNNRSMATTAKELHIHTNTLYHRIKKVEDLLKIDFNHYEDHLKVLLAVYLYNTFMTD